MEFLIDLWLPILVSAVFVFVVSSLIHLLTPLHKNDYRGLPGEAKLLGVLRAESIPTGQYAFPYASSMKETSSPEMIQKYQEGPVGYMTVLPNRPPAMGAALVQWFLYSILIGFLVAYVAHVQLAAGAEYRVVFRITGTIAVIAYAIGHIHESIWLGRPWSTTFKHMLGGLVYGLCTGGVFGWLWPEV